MANLFGKIAKMESEVKSYLYHVQRSALIFDEAINDYMNNNIARFEVRLDEIGTLKNLEVLSLKNNHLSYIPESFANLNNLKILDLSNNNISYFPRFFQYAPKYVFTLFNLKGNPIRCLSNISLVHLQEFVKSINYYLAQNGTWQTFNSFSLTPKAIALINACYDIEGYPHYSHIRFESVRVGVSRYTRR